MLFIKFVYGSCKADYIGLMKRHLSTRIKEHLETDKKSHVCKHLNESQRCKALISNDCFSILDYAATQYSLSIKEGMHTAWQKSALNKHVDFLACSVCVYVSMVSNQTTVKVHRGEYNLFSSGFFSVSLF